MAEINSTPLDATERESRWVSPQVGGELLEERAAPAYAQDIEELEATRSYKRAMLDDAASSVSLRKGGTHLPRSSQVVQCRCVRYRRRSICRLMHLGLTMFT